MSQSRQSGEISNPVTDNLDLWTSALMVKSTAGRGSNGRLEAYGIKKLRHLILKLAVIGKLVPQLDEDKSADLCLVKARSKLRSESKGVRRSAWKESTSITAEERKFELPKGWTWARVNDTGFYINGLAFKPTDWCETGRPIIRIQNLTDSTKPLNYAQGEFPEEVVVLSGDLLVSWSATLDAFIWDRDEAVLNQHIFKVIPCYELVIHGFLYWLLKFSIREMEESDHAHGLVMTHINRDPFLEHAVAIPPLAEQRRIVAKVDELMALCDLLEQQQGCGIEAHQALVETLLGTLTSVASAQEFAAAWNRIAEHFDTLFTTEHSIDQLKQTILQLAVMGKLVPQDASDEPAQVFLKRIAKEKLRLVDEGILKKEKPLPDRLSGNVPFEIPSAWQWVNFEDIAIITSGLTLGKKYTGKKVVTLPYLRVANVQRGHLLLDEVKEVEVLESEVERLTVFEGDLLITEGGDWDKVGRTAIWRHELPCVIHQNHVFKARRLLNEQNEVWLEMYLNSEVAKAYFAGSSKQTTNLASINKTQLRACPVALPPLAEQSRIIAKVDELMAFCDAIKARLAEAQTTQIHLADAIVERAVAAPEAAMA